MKLKDMNDTARMIMRLGSATAYMAFGVGIAMMANSPDVVAMGITYAGACGISGFIQHSVFGVEI